MYTIVILKFLYYIQDSFYKKWYRISTNGSTTFIYLFGSEHTVSCVFWLFDPCLKPSNWVVSPHYVLQTRATMGCCCWLVHNEKFGLSTFVPSAQLYSVSWALSTSQLLVKQLCTVLQCQSRSYLLCIVVSH